LTIGARSRSRPQLDPRTPPQAPPAPRRTPRPLATDRERPDYLALQDDRHPEQGAKADDRLSAIVIVRVRENVRNLYRVSTQSDATHIRRTVNPISEPTEKTSPSRENSCACSPSDSRWAARTI